ncbi:nucleotide pyrophosphatase [Nonomuraea sp. NN258]|uniref:alkaline phosphatase family protein n=1 Tax=Nonomuraea antri TaxID=2730852 RepID=UPI0015694AE4|nr:alkaline phosphatase family protein [Nonomuraea antri]NRQ35439.1 nucleotide pyrophosphatase [Nonomuraea antri]
MARWRILTALLAAAVLLPAPAAFADPTPPSQPPSQPQSQPESPSSPPSQPEGKVFNARAAVADPLPVPNLPNGISADKVLVIGLDGLRHDRIAAADAPNLDALIAGGTFGASLLYTNPMAATSSGPGWSTIATGVWPDLHGVRDNSFTGKNYTQYPDFLTRLENTNAGYSTYAAMDWQALGDHGTFSTRIDARIVLNGDANGYPAEDERITQVSEAVLRTKNPDAAFVYLGAIDIAGHNSGAGSQAYLNTIHDSDAQIGRLLAAVRARPTYAAERWTVIVATDHGHTNAGGHGGSSIEERRTFVLASGPGIAAGAKSADLRLVDVAATAFNALKLPVPTGIDGRRADQRAGDPFDALTLSSRVDETGIPAGVLGFTHTPPSGWTLDVSKMPTGGMQEWRGWSFTTDEFWSRAQRDQQRELNVRARGTFAVADSDEWDDKAHGSGPFDSTLVSPSYNVSGRTSVTINYATHYRVEGTQKAQVLVSFNGGADTLVKNYTADVIGKNEALKVTVPAGATSMKVKFHYFDASNNWYWAVDHLRIT